MVVCVWWCVCGGACVRVYVYIYYRAFHHVILIDYTCGAHGLVGVQLVYSWCTAGASLIADMRSNYAENLLNEAEKQYRAKI